MDGKDDWGAYGSTATGNLVFAAARSVTEFTGRTKKVMEKQLRQRKLWGSLLEEFRQLIGSCL